MPEAVVSMSCTVPLLTTMVLVVSVAVKLPACVAVLLARRAVNWNDQALWEISLTVTLRCCLTPGEYVVPEGKASDTVPPVAAPLWQELQVPSPGAPVLPAGGWG